MAEKSIQMCHRTQIPAQEWWPPSVQWRIRWLLKQKLKNNNWFKKVYLRSAKSYTDLILELNFKTFPAGMS